MFTDVRGFTALSEVLPPKEVTKIMNDALTIQANAVQKYGGMVDKYIGDAMMAIFNAPLNQENHEELAIKTALQIRHDMKEAKLGIVRGNMGSASRFDYTAIGDAVNTAARLESATKEVGVDILIGENTAKNCKFVLKSLQAIKVKGKKAPLKIWTINDE